MDYIQSKGKRVFLNLFHEEKKISLLDALKINPKKKNIGSL